MSGCSKTFTCSFSATESKNIIPSNGKMVSRMYEGAKIPDAASVKISDHGSIRGTCKEEIIGGCEWEIHLIL
jgi:hypothetical protein